MQIASDGFCTTSLYDFPQNNHPVTHSVCSRWVCNVKFCRTSSTAETLGRLLWGVVVGELGSQTDKIYLSDFELPGTGIRLCPGFAEAVDITVLGDGGVAEFATYIAQGYQ